MRTRHLLATGLLAALVVPATPATATTETCQGRPTTIVGTPGQELVNGTEGDDVVVTNGASLAYTRGGNDLVCVTGPALNRTVVVEAGTGDDVVDATAAPGATYAVLGAGSDTYTVSVGARNLFANYPDPDKTGESATNGRVYRSDSLVDWQGGFWYLKASASF